MSVSGSYKYFFFSLFFLCFKTVQIVLKRGVNMLKKLLNFNNGNNATENTYKEFSNLETY